MTPAGRDVSASVAEVVVVGGELSTWRRSLATRLVLRVVMEEVMEEVADRSVSAP